MNWLVDLLYKETVAHTVVLLCLAIFPGIWLGNRSLAGIKLGIAGVLFSGLAVGALGLPIDNHVLHFVREFGLILFVFAVGLQVGPGFFANFRDQGLKLNGYAAAIVLLGVGVAVVEKFVLHIPMEAMVGILSGAVTNTPGLGAAQQALKDVPTLSESAVALSGTGYAVAYPLGVFGIILTMLLVRAFFKIRITEETDNFSNSRKMGDAALQTFTVQLRNSLLHNKSLRDILELVGGAMVVSRLSRQGLVSVPTDDTVLQSDDLLHIVCTRTDLNKVTALVGVPAELDLRRVPSDVSARLVLVSKPVSAGETLAQQRFAERLGVRITRIARSGVEFIPDGESQLQVGDQITAVGLAQNLNTFATELGDSQAALEHPNLLPIFMGILCGVVLGSVPITLPGLPAPVKLGLAGGPLVIALLMGFKRRIGSLQFHLPPTAGVFMKDLGILLFLAVVGLGSGQSFFAALREGSGWIWMGTGACITLIPMLLVGVLARLRGMNYLTLSGLLAGSMTDPPALGYANSLSSCQAQSIAYASVYPFTMFLRVLTAQVFVMLLAM